MTETSMVADFLHTLKIFTESGVDHVGVDLGPGAVLDASLSVQEPLGDTVIGGLGEDVADLVDLLFGEVAGTSVGVDLGDLASKMSKSSTDTLDDTEREANLMLSVDVGVHHTEEVLELTGASEDKSRRLSVKRAGVRHKEVEIRFCSRLYCTRHDAVSLYHSYVESLKKLNAIYIFNCLYII